MPVAGHFSFLEILLSLLLSNKQPSGLFVFETSSDKSFCEPRMITDEIETIKSDEAFFRTHEHNIKQDKIDKKTYSS